MKFKNSIIINRSISDVYSFFLHIDELPWHTHDFVKGYVKLSDGEARVGTKYKETIQTMQ